jgi:uncharacterized membrane protein
MNKNRLETFSDGVFAIIITIMVLELEAPKSVSYVSIMPLSHKFLSYFMSFIYIGIYWTNHHHLMYTVNKVNGTILWANLHLLFWLSLIPFATAWIGEHHFAPFPMIFYGIILLMNFTSGFMLQKIILHYQGKDSLLSEAIGKDYKGKTSLVLYIIGVVLALFYPLISGVIYILVALLWLVPDKRIEKKINE